MKIIEEETIKILKNEYEIYAKKEKNELDSLSLPGSTHGEEDHQSVISVATQTELKQFDLSVFYGLGID